MRSYTEAIAWLNGHRTASGIGFNPDGRCLELARTARGIGPKYGSARVAAENTPQDKRVYKVRDLRKGMVLYFDDPKDSNRFGHVVTMIGRVKGGNRDSLHDVLVVSNSVQKGVTTVVRGDYFTQHWGDPFQFGAITLNDQPLDYHGSAPKPGAAQLEKFDDDRPRYHVGLLDQAAYAGRKDAREAVAKIDKLVKSLPKDETETRVARFVEAYHTTRILRMGLLKGAVTEGGREGLVKDVFDQLMELVREIPDH